MSVYEYTLIHMGPKMQSDELKAKHAQKHQSETVLVLQGGGSLGAYECGVYKALVKRGIKFDIVSGTSIGAVNAGIIVGSKSGKPEVDLENFWLDVAEYVVPSFLPDITRAMISSYYGAVYGNSRIFSPIWPTPYTMQYSASAKVRKVFPAYGWPPHLYDLNSLKKTLEKYIDFTKLNHQNSPRLIITSTDIQRGVPVVFDTESVNIDAEHLVACAGFPFYGIAWTEKDGKYLWDGALLSNTPLREVINASPRRDKIVYIVNLFPRVQKELPTNMLDIWHRARDILFTEKTDHNIRMSKVISNYLLVMTEMHDILSKAELDEEMRSRLLKIEPLYRQMAEFRGTIIQDVTKIERSEAIHFIFEDADFSITTIRNLISQGESDAQKTLSSKDLLKQESKHKEDSKSGQQRQA
jgi:NTE family protein